MSGKTKHTPGPWVLRTIDQSLATVETQDGRYIIGHAGQLREDDWKTGHIERRSNARLIAAAPELLDVVKGFRRKLETYVNVYPGDKELRRLLSNCDAAIAKATGETA